MSGMARLKAVLDAGVFEGMAFTVLDRPIQAGDTYLAARNSGPHLLTAKMVVPYPTAENGLTHGGWVVPQESAYPFDLTECVPIEFADDAAQGPDLLGALGRAVTNAKQDRRSDTASPR